MSGLNQSKSSWKECGLTPLWWVCGISQSPDLTDHTSPLLLEVAQSRGLNILFGDSVAFGHLQLITKSADHSLWDVILWTVISNHADLGSFCALCTLCAFFMCSCYFLWTENQTSKKKKSFFTWISSIVWLIMQQDRNKE